MKNFRLLFLAIIMIASCRSLAQGISINEDGSAADSSAILDVKSTSKGLLPPRMTTAQISAINNPAEGLMVYNIDTHAIVFYNGTSWQNLVPAFYCGNQVMDADSNIYNTVLIGSQCWMKENLNTGIMINGSSNQTDNAIIEKYCLMNDPDSCDIYGGLYQWDEMMQYVTAEGTQGICPPDWHIPTDAEWKILEGNVDTQYGVGDPEWDGTYLRGYDAGIRLKSTTAWQSGGNGTDTFGFTSLPGGFRYTNPYFIQIGLEGDWWSATESYSSNAWGRGLYFDSDAIGRNSSSKVFGFSVRCLRD